MNLSRRLLIPAAVLMMVAPAFAGDVDTYKIDAVHSTVGFKIRHLIARTTGNFAKFEGTIDVNTKDITKSSVAVTIDAASINTGNEAREKHLKSPDFFDTAKFPTITFKSTAVKEVAKGKLEVTGAFTLHGVTRTIVIPVTNLGTMAGMKPGSVVAGFEGALTIKRSDYGMSGMIGPLGDEVEISLNIEAGKTN
ncbi:MAG TPA: YceI family protein [Holophaga sp.]|nr:YceI family protein [Holophaga sp.]